MVKKYNLNFCIMQAKKRNGFCLSKTYKNSTTKMEWMCEKGHKWSTTLYCVYNKKSWCPTCSGCEKVGISKCREIALERNGICLSETYVNNSTKLLWECEYKHQWEASYNNTKKGKWCPKCYSLYKRGRSYSKYNIEDCQKIASDNNGKCLSKKYSIMLTWECEDKHKWDAPYYNILQGKWCKICSNSKNEKRVRSIFEDYFNKEFPTVRPDFLKNPETGYNLELDGYCDELKLAFEYDGEQHYRKIDLWQSEEEFKKQQNRDRLKNILCEKHQVFLIRIPYFVKDNLSEFVLKELKDLLY